MAFYPALHHADCHSSHFRFLGVVPDSHANGVTDGGNAAPSARPQLLPRDSRGEEHIFRSTECIVGVLRHSARMVALVHRAEELARAAGERLLLCFASDHCRTREGVASDPELLRYLCNIHSLSETQNLPGVLFLWRGCRLVLEEKVREDLGLIRGCVGLLRTIVLDPEEPPFDADSALPPVCLSQLPLSLLLDIPGQDFLQSSLLQPGTCGLFPCGRDWTHRCHLDRIPLLDAALREQRGEQSLRVHRRQLPCTNALAATAYNLQGQEVPAMLLDLARPRGMQRARA